MSYRLTQHARDVLAERQIPIAWMEEVLDSPELTQASPDDPEVEYRFGRIAEFGGRVLRIVINRTNDPVLVVTVYFDRGMRGRL